MFHVSSNSKLAFISHTFGEIEHFFRLDLVCIVTCIPYSVVVVIVEQADIVFGSWLQEVEVACLLVADGLLAYDGIG